MSARKYLVEFIGAFFLIFAVGMAVIEPGGSNALAPLAPIAIGAMLMVMVYAGGHVSGAHYNPAVTLGVWIRGKCGVADVVPYMIAQCLAAAAAASVVLYLKVGEQVTANATPMVPAMIAEALFTFALVFVVLNVATAKANAGNSYFGLAIGFTVTAGAYATAGFGAAANPAVAIGGCMMGLLKWADLWFHLVGQGVGAVLAAIVFKIAVRDQS